MKLLHLGDLHIGKSVNDFSMIEDQEYILNQILKIAIEQNVDGVLIAGDVYDRTIPSEEAVRVFDDFLCKLSAKKIDAYIISGNHDSDERLHFGSRLFEQSGIHIASKYNGTMYCHSVEDDFGTVHIYLLPFVKASQVRHYFPDAEINNYHDAVEVVIRETEINPAERNVIVAHQFVAGRKELPQIGGSENVSVKRQVNRAEETVGTVELVYTDCFDDFDYVALGHIHAAQKIGREEVRYSGSPLKYSKSEIFHQKSVPMITLNEKGTVEIELIPLKPLRDMRQLTGKMEQLLRAENVEDPEDYIFVTLTDENPVQDAILVFRQTYPNTMKIEYDNSHTRSMEKIELSETVMEKPFSELAEEFYQMMYGTEMSKEEMEILMQAAKEVGINEAD
jgi:exonuclease SbcD